MPSEVARRITIHGTNESNQQPVACEVDWFYPTEGSSLTIDICHVRVVDDIRIRFDFEAHEWVVEQELQAREDHAPATGKWIEVARWSGNAPMVSKRKDGWDSILHTQVSR